jgi:hypothetical protein
MGTSRGDDVPSAAALRVNNGVKLPTDAANHLSSYLAVIEPITNPLQIRTGEEAGDVFKVESARRVASVTLGMIPSK